MHLWAYQQGGGEMSVGQNPFTHCKVIQTHTGWHVASDFWRVKAASEGDARRIREIVHAAYIAGAEDLRGQINRLLFPDMEDSIREGE